MEITLGEIAREITGELRGDPERIIRGVAPFEDAGPAEITLAGSVPFLKRIGEASAGAALVPSDFDGDAPMPIVRVKRPEVAFAKLRAMFFPEPKPEPGISPDAVVSEAVTLGAEVSIGACAVIERHAVIGDRTVVHPGVFIGEGVQVGRDATIHPNTTILRGCRIGDRVVIHSGTVIGADGFGYAFDGKIHHKIPHSGIVQIDDDVEIGAGNTIDRAGFGRTWIQRGVKTDNLVHIAHNVTVGEDTLLVAQVGVAGSVTIGKNAILAGQAGISQHLSIGDGAIVGPQAGVGHSIPAGEVVSGSPEISHRLWLRVQRIIPRLPDLKKKLADLEKRIDKIDKASG